MTQKRLVRLHDKIARDIARHRQDLGLIKIVLESNDDSNILYAYYVKEYNHNLECIELLKKVKKEVTKKLDI